MWFPRSRPLEATHKGNQGEKFIGRRFVISIFVSNEFVLSGGIGRVNSKFRMLLGRWSIDKEWFPITYEVAVMINVFTNNLHHRGLVPLSRLLLRQASYNATGGDCY